VTIPDQGLTEEDRLIEQLNSIVSELYDEQEERRNERKIWLLVMVALTAFAIIGWVN
jgi:hypothetical protein